MAMRTIRVRFHAGRLDPIEPLQLDEGAELEVSLREPEAIAEARAPGVQLDTWDLGPMGPLTRAQIYEDVG